ncbi:hypothetical protein LP422_19195 [Janibacter limosus]|uniref:Uncharacterized protein n=1 Tax=Janibacter limosus TaxID=53458 RepID=A0AC61U3A7_9MICO|nr:hypothetical protein [Janibacter limosus]UUZ44489.1 hypothetical protein LP422_19195 [Janibacter limosus]
MCDLGRDHVPGLAGQQALSGTTGRLGPELLAPGTVVESSVLDGDSRCCSRGHEDRLVIPG